MILVLPLEGGQGMVPDSLGEMGVETHEPDVTRPSGEAVPAPEPESSGPDRIDVPHGGGIEQDGRVPGSLGGEWRKLVDSEAVEERGQSEPAESGHAETSSHPVTRVSEAGNGTGSDQSPRGAGSAGNQQRMVVP